MGGLAQKVKNLFIRNEELLPIRDDEYFHSYNQNQRNEFDKISSGSLNQVELQNQNLNKEILLKQESISKELDKILCPVRMITMMQGQQYNTQIYKNQQNKIGEIISKLN